MAFQSKVNPQAAAFVKSLSPGDQGRLFRCLRLLQLDPPIDNVSVFNFSIPPLVFRLHHCDGFDTLYKVDHQANLLVVFSIRLAAQPGQTPTRFHP